MRYTTCTICGGKVLIEGVELKKEMSTCGIERTYWICPHCGFSYTVLLTDEEIRGLMLKRDALKPYFSDPRNTREIKKYMRLSRKIKNKINQLNGK